LLRIGAQYFADFPTASSGTLRNLAIVVTAVAPIVWLPITPAVDMQREWIVQDGLYQHMTPTTNAARIPAEHLRERPNGDVLQKSAPDWTASMTRSA